MNNSRLLFIVATAINAVVPIFVGAILISVHITVENAKMQIRENKGAEFALIHAPLAAIFFFSLTISFAFLVFFLPCIITSLLLGTTTLRLLSKSKVLYIISTIFLGTGAAAFWLFLCELHSGNSPLREGNPLITFCAGFGFLTSSLLVCLVCKPTISK